MSTLTVVTAFVAFAIACCAAFALGRITAPSSRRVVWSDADRRQRAIIAQLALTPLQALETSYPANAETMPEHSVVQTRAGVRRRAA